MIQLVRRVIYSRSRGIISWHCRYTTHVHVQNHAGAANPSRGFWRPQAEDKSWLFGYTEVFQAKRTEYFHEVTSYKQSQSNNKSTNLLVTPSKGRTGTNLLKASPFCFWDPTQWVRWSSLLATRWLKIDSYSSYKSTFGLLCCQDNW